MALNYRQIRDDRQWRSATGLNKSQFNKLVVEFKLTYEGLLGESISKRISNSSSKSSFRTYEDLLFFILYSIKSGLTYDLLALSFDMNRSNAYRIQCFGLRMLERTLARLDFMPRRFFEDLDDFKEVMSEQETIILDACEQRRQRPQNEEDQKDDYSGKKNTTP